MCSFASFITKHKSSQILLHFAFGHKRKRSTFAVTYNNVKFISQDKKKKKLSRKKQQQPICDHKQL